MEEIKNKLEKIVSTELDNNKVPSQGVLDTIEVILKIYDID